jgi:hypothetical protein
MTSDGEKVCRPSIAKVPIGFWLLLDDREYFVPFADYPVFQAASITQIYGVERIAPDQLYWPTLDVDIDLRSLEYPEAFPLVFKKEHS